MKKPLLLFATLLGSTTAFGEIAAERQDQLLHMLRHDCGSCHGMTMKGGLGPALLPADLEGKEPATLAATVLYGRGATAMPSWREILTEEEATWLVSILRNGVPHE